MSIPVRYERDDNSMLGEPPWKPDDPALVAWEEAHGHDVRLRCSTDYHCRLVDRDLEEAKATIADLRDRIATTSRYLERNIQSPEFYLDLLAGRK